MKTKQKKQSPEDDLDVLEIKLERIPVENIAEVTETLAYNFLRNAELGIFYVCYATPKQWPRGRPLRLRSASPILPKLLAYEILRSAFDNKWCYLE
jgi:hypothetical protein